MPSSPDAGAPHLEPSPSCATDNHIASVSHVCTFCTRMIFFYLYAIVPSRHTETCSGFKLRENAGDTSWGMHELSSPPVRLCNDSLTHAIVVVSTDTGSAGKMLCGACRTKGHLVMEWQGGRGWVMTGVSASVRNISSVRLRTSSKTGMWVTTHLGHACECEISGTKLGSRICVSANTITMT